MPIIGGGTRGARGAMAPPDFLELKNYPSIKFQVNQLIKIKCTVKVAGKLIFN